MPTNEPTSIQTLPLKDTKEDDPLPDASISKLALNRSGSNNEDIIEQLILLLNPQDNTAVTKDVQALAYLDNCKIFGTVPSSYLASHLNLTHVALTNYGLGAKGAMALARVLESNRSIVSLDLSGNGIQAEGGVAFGEMLKCNICLKELILNNNQLGGVGGQAIADGVTDNITLQTLALRGNQLSDEETIRFGTALRTNRTLMSLDLGHNAIGDIGAAELGVGLDINDALKALNLEWNHIRIRGISMFLNAVKVRFHPSFYIYLKEINQRTF
ncbi:hypothetical protein HMI56_001470 [Coelomomyces lativittatus]|nr:hypothetical protein HMI56_001470 [Coelomomyces lativittatus]